MGLDMYLYRTAKMEDNFDYEKVHNADLKVDEIDQLPEPMQKYASPYEYGCLGLRNFEEYAYWRKFNALHNWFVINVQDNVDECHLSRPITEEDFENLLEELVEDSLEPTSGFFFGSTEKGDRYYEKQDRTIEIVRKILKEVDFEKEVMFYRSSW